MKNISIRLYTFSNYLMYAVPLLAGAIWLYSLLLPERTVSANPTIQLFGHIHDNCYIKFTPNIDLTNYFNLNTKQIFLYAICTTGTQHEMIWSTIVQYFDKKQFIQPVIGNYKFKIIDGVNTFNKITFKLRGSILPHVGKTSDILFSIFEYDNSKNILTT